MSKPRPIVLVAVSAVGIGGLAIVGAVIYFLGSAWFGLPVGAQAPEQPIAFSHAFHAGVVTEEGLGLDCTFCHRNVAQGAAATIPSVEQCMFCHAYVGGTTDSAMAEIQKIRDASEAALPINWNRVHRLPDHVEFVHDAHIRFFTEENDVAPAQVCSICHGDVDTMTRVKQVRALKMGDCVSCHREYSAPTDCTTCHN